jgi:hypothetical protein
MGIFLGEVLMGLSKFSEKSEIKNNSAKKLFSIPKFKTSEQ